MKSLSMANGVNSMIHYIKIGKIRTEKIAPEIMKIA